MVRLAKAPTKYSDERERSVYFYVANEHLEIHGGANIPLPAGTIISPSAFGKKVSGVVNRYTLMLVRIKHCTVEHKVLSKAECWSQALTSHSLSHFPNLLYK